MFALIIFGVCQAVRHDERVVAEACASRVPGWAAYGDEIMASEAPAQGKRGVAYVARLPQTHDHDLNTSVPRVVFAVVRRGDARRIRQVLRDRAVAASAAASGCAPRIYYAGGLGDNSSRVMTIAEMAGDRVGADFLRETDARLARRFGRLLACVHGLELPAPAPPATLRGWLGAASVGAVADRGALVGAYAAQIAKYWWPPVRDSRAAEDKFSRIYDFAFERAAAWTTSRLAAAPVTVHDDVHVGNILARALAPDGSPELRLIDYENAHRGGAIADLAPYSRCCRDRTNVRAMLGAYHEARFREAPSRREVERALFDLEVGLAFQMLDTLPKCRRVARSKSRRTLEGLDWACPSSRAPEDVPPDVHAHLDAAEAAFAAIDDAARGDDALRADIVDRGVLAAAAGRSGSTTATPPRQLLTRARG
jgi:hypothetical protein